jgi:hypothetical protein
MSEATIDSHPTKTKHPKIMEAAETVDDKIIEAAEKKLTKRRMQEELE